MSEKNHIKTIMPNDRENIEASKLYIEYASLEEENNALKLKIDDLIVLNEGLQLACEGFREYKKIHENSTLLEKAYTDAMNKIKKLEEERLYISGLMEMPCNASTDDFENWIESAWKDHKFKIAVLEEHRIIPDDCQWISKKEYKQFQEIKNKFQEIKNIFMNFAKIYSANNEAHLSYHSQKRTKKIIKNFILLIDKKANFGISVRKIMGGEND